MKRYAIALLVIGLVIAIGIAGYFLLRPKRNPDVLVLFGNVDVRLVDIGFRVPGRVAELLFEEGDLVNKGDLMARLDITPYDSQARQAQATMASTQVSYKNAERLLTRREGLIDIGGVSAEDLDNASASYYELQASLNQAEANLAVALDNLAYTEATAPTDGIILTRIREPGTVVREADPVYTLSVTSPVWIRAFVDEPQLGQVYYGMPAEIHTDTKGGPVYTGHVGFISPLAEFTPKTVETAQLRTDLVYRLRIYADNPDRGLKQGMPVTVKLKLNESSHETQSE